MGIYHRSDVNFRFIKETVFFILIDNRIYAPGIHCGDATIIILHKLAKGKLHKSNRHNTCWHEIILFCTGLYSMDKISREARQCHRLGLRVPEFLFIKTVHMYRINNIKIHYFSASTNKYIFVPVRIPVLFQ